MDHESEEGLPTLACPLIVSPSMGAAQKPIHLPPFPEIDLSWEGFTVSHLHWVGIKPIPRDPSRDERRRYYLGYVHELGHRALSESPFSRFKTELIFKFYNAILRNLMAKRQISVPLASKRWRKKGRNKW